MVRIEQKKTSNFKIQPLRECLLIEIFGDKKGIVKQKQPHQGTNSTATNVKTPTQVEIARDTPISMILSLSIINIICIIKSIKFIY
jgi:hypothetical protein